MRFFSRNTWNNWILGYGLTASFLMAISAYWTKIEAERAYAAALPAAISVTKIIAVIEAFGNSTTEFPLAWRFINWFIDDTSMEAFVTNRVLLNLSIELGLTTLIGMSIYVAKTFLDRYQQTQNQPQIANCPAGG